MFQLSILNASSIFGRTFLNLLADGAGQFNVVCPVAICSAGLLFVMFSATNTANVIVFAILYGFFSGGCEYLAFVLEDIANTLQCITVSSLIPPTIAALSPDLTEIGCVLRHHTSIHADHVVIVDSKNSHGNRVLYELVRAANRHADYRRVTETVPMVQTNHIQRGKWYTGPSGRSLSDSNIDPQAVICAGTTSLLIARHIMTKRKNSQHV